MQQWLGAIQRHSGSVRRYLCLSVDVKGYGTNDDLRQMEIQRDLLELLDRAAKRAGLRRRRWNRQAQGDAELALIPAREPLGRVVGEFCLELKALLGLYNAERESATRMRLRLALDEGPVDVCANGFVGRAVVGVSRLVNAKALRSALDDGDDLAVLLSDGVCRDWVHSGRSAVRAEWLSAVSVREKEHQVQAWLWRIGRVDERIDGPRAAWPPAAWPPAA
jgi:hypothetical protein